LRQNALHESDSICFAPAYRLGFSPKGVNVVTRMNYSPDVDALLIEFSEKDIDYAQDMGQFIVHFSEDGELVLLEILDARDFLLEALSNVVKRREVLKKTTA